jgi:hypothetical protein
LFSLIVFLSTGIRFTARFLEPRMADLDRGSFSFVEPSMTIRVSGHPSGLALQVAPHPVGGAG